jgi:hypothetical protein
MMLNCLTFVERINHVLLVSNVQWLKTWQDKTVRKSCFHCSRRWRYISPGHDSNGCRGVGGEGRKGGTRPSDWKCYISLHTQGQCPLVFKQSCFTAWLCTAEQYCAVDGKHQCCGTGACIEVLLDHCVVDMQAHVPRDIGDVEKQLKE